MSTDIPTICDRFHDICGYGGSDDVNAVQALAEEVGVEAMTKARNDERNSCLHVASVWNRVNTARQLIAWGADAECKNTAGRTPLFRAKSAEMVHVLVKEGNAEVNVLSTFGHSALISAVCRPKVMETLLDEGALVKFGKFNPLVWVSSFGHIKVMKVLLAHRGFVRLIEWKGSDGMTPREALVREMYSKTVEIKIRHQIVAMLDEALVLAKIWERRLPVFRIGMAAVDARLAKQPADTVFRGPKRRITDKQ